MPSGYGFYTCEVSRYEESRAKIVTGTTSVVRIHPAHATSGVSFASQGGRWQSKEVCEKLDIVG